MKKELPKIVFDDEIEKKPPKKEFKITYEIKTENVGGNETNKILEGKTEERKITRINDLILDNKIKKAPHPPALPIPKMPAQAPHPPELPIPQKLNLETKLKLRKMEGEKQKKEIKRKIKKSYLIILIFLFMIVGSLLLGFGLYFKSENDKLYKEAVALYEQGQTKNIEEFCSTHSGYGNCKNYEKYMEAIVLFESNYFDDAEKLFVELKDFYESKNYLIYIKALTEFNNHNLEKAIKELEQIKKLPKVDYYIEYIELINSLNNNEDVELETRLNILDDYIDVTIIKNYLEAKELYNDKDFTKVIELLETPSKVIKKANDLYIDSKYNKAKLAQAEGFISTAYSLLKEIGNYKDSVQILEQPIFNVINNWKYTYTNNGDEGSLSLSFYASSNTCYYVIKNGDLLDLTPNTVENTYNYKILNNTLYFENENGEYVAIYQIRNFGENELILQINQNRRITLKKV